MSDFSKLLNDYATGKSGATCSHPINMVYTHDDGSEICTACGAVLKPKGNKATMSAADIISDVQLIDLTHRDAQFVRAELIEKIDSAIAAAVAAERDALEAIVYRAIMDNNLATYNERDMIASEVAAAIRARGGTEWDKKDTNDIRNQF